MLLKVSFWAKDRVNPLPSNGYHEGLLWYSKSLLTPYLGAITMRVSDLSQGVDKFGGYFTKFFTRTQENEEDSKP